MRGAPGSEATAMIFASISRIPVASRWIPPRARRCPTAAPCGGGRGHRLLLLVIFCVTDERNTTRPQLLTPVTIGLTVTMLISLIARSPWPA
jgi:hypothetical protein